MTESSCSIKAPYEIEKARQSTIWACVFLKLAYPTVHPVNLIPHQRIYIGLVMGLWLVGCRPEPVPFNVEDIRTLPSHFPAYVEPENNPMNEAKWELGQRLFFDQRLGSDGQLSCASCHRPELAFSDNQPTSLGPHGVQGTRNTPALMNLAWQPRFHREGGIPSLEAQILAPLQEPTEFNQNLEDLVTMLSLDEDYQALAQEGFERDFDAYVLTRSIAAFERTLISGASAYDRWLQGDSSALSAFEMQGLQVFESLECGSCHQGTWLTDFDNHNNGLYADYPDPGAFRLTLDSADIGAFKTPTLRNVGITSPYMFDGSLQTLDEVIEHYASGGSGHPNQDLRIQPFELTDEEKAQLIAFLNSMTDHEFVDWAVGLRP